MNIERWTKPVIKEFRTPFGAALAALGKEYGLDIQACNASFSAGVCTFKVECRIVGEDGKAKTREREALEQFHPDMADKEVQNGAYRVTGYRTKARSKPWLIERISDGAVFVTNNQGVGYDPLGLRKTA